MTDQTPPTLAQPSPAATPPRDPWAIWFSRLMQVVGLALVVYEAVAKDKDRPYLLLVAMAMMLGGLGLQLVLRWALKRFAP